MENTSKKIISRFDLINYFIKKFKYKTYLEIGISEPHLCFDKIQLPDEYKVGVDPAHWIPSFNRKNLINTTSDNFFAINEKYFDIIFIDGLHLDFQVQKDIENSLKKLNKNGTIILHDCNPVEEIHQVEVFDPSKCPAWMGTTWKAFVRFIKKNKNKYIAYTIEADCGLGVIQRPESFIFEDEKLIYDIEDEELTYNFLEKNRKQALNLISVERFFEIENE